MRKKYGKNLIPVICVIFSVCLLAISAGTASASGPKLDIKDSSYSAEYVSQSASDPIEIIQGETKEIIFKFKNTGTATWESKGGRHISAYTVEPKYRDSLFRGPNWISSDQTALIPGIVEPGKIGELKLQLTASQEPGDYVERFYLSAENHTWLNGGYFFVKIKVNPKKNTEQAVQNMIKKTVDEKEAKNSEQPKNPEDYKTNRFILNKKEIIAKGGEKVKIVIGFQNTGSAHWKRYSLLLASTANLAGKASASFADGSWETNSIVFQNMAEEPIAPESSFRETFYIRAPKEKGEYTAKFRLTIDELEVEGAEIKIPVTVTENAPINYTEPVFSNDEPLEKPMLSEEPRVRVGILATEKALQFASFDDDYDVYDGGDFIGTLPKKKIAILRHSNGVYSIKGGDMDFKTANAIRLSPRNNPHAVFQLLNLKRYLKRVGADTFNEYRGAVEYRIGKNDGMPYAVNDLLLDDYVAGIAETENTNAIEFIKANLTAARTYAYISKDKYSFFDLLGSTHDQLYLGYKSEQIMNNVAEAVKATRGKMVTYKGEPVTTPYFGNSNGRTKSWASAWGGTDKPWLVTVTAHYDSGRKQYGHGVGMSQRDANLRAQKEGLSWEELLRYYYTGIDIALMYN